MKYLYYLYQTLVALPILLVVTILTAVTTSAGCTLGDARFWGYYPPMLWSRIICRVLLLPVRVEGKALIDDNTSYVFVANHQGAFDIFLAYGFLGRNFKWMMKKGLGRIPLVGRACRKAGHIFVDKGGPKAIQHTYDEARRVLKSGTSVFVFPEGARTFTGHMGLFHRGGFQLADELQLPIVPITIDGSFDVMPRMRDLKFCHWHPLTLTIHAPIPPKGKGPDNIKASMAEAYDAIMAGLPAERQGYVKNDDQ